MIRRVYEHVSPIAALGIVIVVLMTANVVVEAHAGSITIENSAARLERRQAAREGRLSLPLPGTPDTEAPLTRLASVGVNLGARTMIRVFKAESQFEVWVQKGGVYVHFASYRVCFWSGKLGPKLREGDRQTPEGFYTITSEQLHFGDRWQRSLDIGFPNVFDRINGRTGSVILVHGGCDSSGCFAMTNKVSEEIYEIVAASLRSGQQYVPVHVFPFRMSAENIAAQAGEVWSEFWNDLKQGYESFERTRLPPVVSVCGKRYRVEDAVVGRSEDTGVELCPVDAIAFGSANATPISSKGDGDSRAKSTNARKRASVSHACSMARASCRRWVALRGQKMAGNFTAGRRHASR
jgi:murein L,D-transpeptidase YafK